MNRLRARLSGMLGVAWLVLALSLVSAVFAQTDTGSVRGTVTDQQGRAVTEAQVTITNADTAYSRSLKTDANGSYGFQSLPVGRYSLRVAGAPTCYKHKKKKKCAPRTTNHRLETT